MLIDERTLFFCVALETNSILSCRRAELALHKSAMRIVAIVALHQAFVHPMMERPVELLFCFEVATVTKLGLLIAQEMLCNFGMMRRMALNAADIVLHVGCPGEVVVLRIHGVTSQTTFACVFRARIFESEDFCRICAFGMLFAGAVAGFAPLPTWTPLRIVFSN